MGVITSLVERILGAVAAMDTDAVLAITAPDAEILDPHYPTRPMVGRDQIADGLAWAFSQMKSMSFSIERVFEASDGLSAAVEVTSRHQPKMGREIVLRQVFVVESDGKRITGLTAYEPYGPDGIAGMGLAVGHLVHRARHGLAKPIRRSKPKVAP